MADKALKFKFEKETKTTFRFQEQDVAEGARPVVGTLYLSKSFVDPVNGTKPVTDVTLTIALGAPVADTAPATPAA